MDELPGQPLPPPKPDPLVKAVRGLSRAVWCMAIGILLLFGFFLTMTLWPMIYSRHTVGPVTQRSEPPTWQPEKFEGKDFNDLPVEKKIKYASVILITKHVKTGDVTREVIAEIVKVKPGTDFHRKVGDELKSPGMFPGGVPNAGDGEVVLMVGSPPDLRESDSYEGDQFGGPGTGMSLERLRELAKGEGK